MKAYCVKCKDKQEMKDAEPGFNKKASPVTRGTCSVCGTKMVRMGYTPEHEGLVKPEVPKKTIKRKGKLVIVESPAKARTVGRFLGKDYTVKASVGHVRDLLRSSLSVDVEDNFKPKYRVPNEKRPVVKELKENARHAEEIYLATDPDREGEAIAWHLLESIEVDPELTKRVVFHEITEPAIADAFEHPRDINMDLVDAQQARRILDRLVGYSISPILWEKVRSRLSAGRVQSVALRLIVEREREIEAFVPQEYWSVEADFEPDGTKDNFRAKLAKINGEDFNLVSEDETNQLLTKLNESQYSITKLKKGTRRRKPYAPFITSTLQQDASRRLGFTAKKTMQIAQQLYEGLEVGENGTSGLITYMRTDSTAISETAQKEARDYILKKYGKEYLPEKPRIYKTKAKGAQEAHEAIRPTSVMRIPQTLKAFLSRDQYRLYKLIWNRFIASQMESAVFDTLTVEVTGTKDAEEFLFRASGSAIQFPGFLTLYDESKEDNNGNGNGNGNGELANIPLSLEEGQKQKLLELFPEQHFTQPPPRYTEATLVQTMEEFGIGRPSTYAPILTTIQARGYVVREQKRLFPTEVGMLVNDLLVEFFDEIIDTQFTANMEENLDKVSEGSVEWTNILSDFYKTFEPKVTYAQEQMPVKKAEPEKIGRECPQCGHDLIIRWGRYGKFISCSNFPECRYTEPFLEKINVPCPDCETGEIVRRKSRKGRIFYGCSNYPECEFTSWKEPLKAKCSKCDGTLAIANKKQAICLSCETRYPLEEFEENMSETA